MTGGIRDVDGLLGPYRVLDLTDARGLLCGKILGDLGADVIKIERPGGDPARLIGPFHHDVPDPERSLYWLSFNTNKRGITLDIEQSEGRDIFRRLVENADFVVESYAPDHMQDLGLGYASLRNLNKRVIMTSISPFGQTGPYKDYAGSDIVLMAMGGLMHICGDSDRPPVRISHPQAFLHASAHAAAGTLFAHYRRQITGEGQHVDVSAQESVVSTLQIVQQFWDLTGYVVPRSGPAISRGDLRLQTVRRCKDGFVAWRVMVGQAGVLGGRGTHHLVSAMAEEGMADGLKHIDWEHISLDDVSQQQMDQWNSTFDAYFAAHTKQELYDMAMKRHVPLFPVNTPKDIVSNEQLKARGFWTDVEHPGLGDTITYPGAFFKSATDFAGIRRPAPMIGEHNHEILQQELGLTGEQIAALKKRNIV